MQKMPQDLFKEKMQGLQDEAERGTVKELKTMLEGLERPFEYGFGTGKKEPAFYVKWKQHGNNTAVRIAYTKKTNHFKVWFYFKDLDKENPALKKDLEHILVTSFDYLKKKWGTSPFNTSNPSLPVSECIGKVHLIEGCLKLL